MFRSCWARLRSRARPTRRRRQDVLHLPAGVGDSVEPAAVEDLPGAPSLLSHRPRLVRVDLEGVVRRRTGEVLSQSKVAVLDVQLNAPLHVVEFPVADGGDNRAVLGEG